MTDTVLIDNIFVGLGVWLMAIGILVLALDHFSSQRQIRALKDERIRLVQELDKITVSKDSES